MTAYQLIRDVLSMFGEDIERAENFSISALGAMRGFDVYVANPDAPIEGAVIPLGKAPELTPIYAWPDHSDNLETYTTDWPSNFADCPREEWQGLVIR